jgi:hypothetical protein
MESSRVIVENAHRCPFCHESVTLESDWLACRQCLARQHAACWRESNRCGACQGETALIPGTPVVLEGDPVEAIRKETQRTALEAAHRDERTARLLLGLATFGVHSFLDACWSFGAHARDGEVGDAARAIERARARASEGATRILAIFAVLAILLPVLGLWGLSAVQVGGIALARGAVPWDDPTLAFACVLQAVVCIPVLVALHVFREAVRRHELHQALARLVAEAVPPLAANEFLRFTQLIWNVRRFLDVAVSCAALVPVLGMLFVPLAGIRMRGALALHEENELLLPRRSARVPVK